MQRRSDLGKTSHQPLADLRRIARRATSATFRHPSLFFCDHLLLRYLLPTLETTIPIWLPLFANRVITCHMHECPCSEVEKDFLLTPWALNSQNQDQPVATG